MNDVVTMDQLRDLIKTEKIKPEDLFTPEQLKDVLLQARTEGYTEGRLMSEAEATTAILEKQRAEVKVKDDIPDAINPEKNPMIKI